MDEFECRITQMHLSDFLLVLVEKHIFILIISRPFIFKVLLPSEWGKEKNRPTCLDWVHVSACVCALACRPNVPVCNMRPLKTITPLKLMRIAKKKTPKQIKQRSVLQKRGSRWSIRGWRLGETECGCAQLISKLAFSAFLANSQHKNQFHRKLNVRTEIEGISLAHTVTVQTLSSFAHNKNWMCTQVCQWVFACVHSGCHL